MEIVVEVSASNFGGLNATVWLSLAEQTSYGMSWRLFSLIAFGIATATVAFTVLSFAFFRYKRDFTISAFMLALYVHFFTSKDMLYIFHFHTFAAMIAELISALAAFALLVLHFYRNGATFKKPFVISTAATAGVSSILLVAFYGTPLAPWFGGLLWASMCVYLVPFIFNRAFSAFHYVVYGILSTFLLSIFFFELCEWLGLFVFGTEFIFTAELMVIIACFAVLWLRKLANTTQLAVRASEYEYELAALSNRVLRAQVEPHFIFNSLTAIQSQYHDGISEGDSAMQRFAAHLRLITDSNSDDMIPFDDEVRNTLNYFELEKLRASGELELLLDLNYTDFSVPVLSLQPLVDNAIKHGGLRDKKDGYITISSDVSDGTVTVSVSDNGKGFCPDAVHRGVGLENTRKRFELVGAKMTVHSSPGAGTRITIEIPLE